MKRRYEKPFIGSERVFSLASQACDVNVYCPGVCQDHITYIICYPFDYKVKYEYCTQIPPNPVGKS
ncbi:MAG TPA: hypothetical protein VMW93_11080 [bacterium]|nr:hypothetical protein [bacterium]